jgi:hypothetical protein
MVDKNEIQKMTAMIYQFSIVQNYKFIDLLLDKLDVKHLTQDAMLAIMGQTKEVEIYLHKRNYLYKVVKKK